MSRGCGPSCTAATFYVVFFSGYQEEELKDHIQKLHDYNEIKDIGQMLLGKIG